LLNDHNDTIDTIQIKGIGWRSTLRKCAPACWWIFRDWTAEAGNFSFLECSLQGEVEGGAPRLLLLDHVDTVLGHVFVFPNKETNLPLSSWIVDQECYLPGVDVEFIACYFSSNHCAPSIDGLFLQCPRQFPPPHEGDQQSVPFDS